MAMLIEISTEEITDVTIEGLKKLSDYAKDKSIFDSFNATLEDGSEITIYPDYKKEY